MYMVYAAKRKAIKFHKKTADAGSQILPSSLSVSIDSASDEDSIIRSIRDGKHATVGVRPVNAVSFSEPLWRTFEHFLSPRRLRFVEDD